jgi:hypothetical protein
MTRTNHLAMAFAFVLGSTSAFAPIVFDTSTSNRAASTTTTSTSTFLVPEQGRQLVAFSQDYLSKMAKESAGKASNLASSRTLSSSQQQQQQGLGVASAAKGLVTRLLGHDMGGPARNGRSLEEELMNAYPKDDSSHFDEDDVLFHQIVD